MVLSWLLVLLSLVVVLWLSWLLVLFPFLVPVLLIAVVVGVVIGGGVVGVANVGGDGVVIVVMGFAIHSIVIGDSGRTGIGGVDGVDGVGVGGVAVKCWCSRCSIVRRNPPFRPRLDGWRCTPAMCRFVGCLVFWWTEKTRSPLPPPSATLSPPL